MKNFFSIILFTMILNPALSMAQSDYKRVTVQPEAVFTPKGFDTNDNAQVVLYGKFIDVCHKLGQVKYSVDESKHRIYIDNEAYMRDICIEIYVNIPYTVVVNLGTLARGKYDIYVSNGNGGYTNSAFLPIKSPSSPQIVDDYLYAQVNEVQFVPTSDSSSPQLILRGMVHNTCLRMKEIKVSLSGGNIYDILPILDMNQGNCQAKETPFENTIILSNFSATSPTLINVRSAGGQSIEKVIDQLRF